MVLHFFILSLSGVILEQGQITARTCQAAIQHAQAGLQPHQRLDLDACVPVLTKEARR